MITYGDLDQITYDTELDGELVRKTLGVRAWEERGWATVMIVFQERTKDLATWRSPKVALLRLRRVGEGWKKHALVTLPAAHAVALGAEIAQRVGELRAPGEPDVDEPDGLTE